MSLLCLEQSGTVTADTTDNAGSFDAVAAQLYAVFFATHCIHFGPSAKT